MISCSFLAQLHRQLIKAKHTHSDQPFAGLDILFVGDFDQFAPIKATPLYYGTNEETAILQSDTNMM